jgi:hypothetical protein
VDRTGEVPIDFHEMNSMAEAVLFILWHTMDLGYLTVYAAEALKNGTLRPGDSSLEAGRLKSVEVKGG